jgi:hypothetical protein
VSAFHQRAGIGAPGGGGGVEGTMPPPFSVLVAQLTMSKPERFKEEIGWLKALGGVLFASSISLCVWLVQNYGALTHIALFMSICIFFIFATGIVAVIVRLYRCFKILEAL